MATCRPRSERTVKERDARREGREREKEEKGVDRPW